MVGFGYSSFGYCSPLSLSLSFSFPSVSTCANVGWSLLLLRQTRRCPHSRKGVRAQVGIEKGRATQSGTVFLHLHLLHLLHLVQWRRIMTLGVPRLLHKGKTLYSKKNFLGELLIGIPGKIQFFKSSSARIMSPSSSRH